MDAEQQPVGDALLEIWRPDAAESSTPLAGFQRVATDPQGGFRFRAPRPRAQAIYLSVTLFARGLLHGLFTRVYLLPEGADATPAEPAFVAPERRQTLIAARSPAEPNRFDWDIRLRGEAETVFFEF